MAEKTYYDNIFEVIDVLGVDHQFTEYLRTGNPIGRTNEYRVMINGDHNLYLPNIFLVRLFRGEPQVYKNSKASLYRQNDLNKIIEGVKMIEFIDIAKNFPECKKFENDNVKIHYETLAQHYGICTRALDLTSDIAVACFFATHAYDSNEKAYEPIKEGTGVIWHYTIDPSNKKLEMTGLQPFDRPAKQMALALILEPEEELIKYAHKIEFKQSLQWNKRIGKLFMKGKKNWLFPNELIDDIAKRIKEDKTIHKTSMMTYIKQHKLNEKNVLKLLDDNGVFLRDNITYQMTQKEYEHREKIVEKTLHSEYQFKARLSYRPKTRIE